MSTIGDDDKVFLYHPPVCQSNGCRLRVNFDNFRCQLDRRLDQFSQPSMQICTVEERPSIAVLCFRFGEGFLRVDFEIVCADSTRLLFSLVQHGVYDLTIVDSTRFVEVEAPSVEDESTVG